MHRDQSHRSASRADGRHARKEWEPAREHRQLEAGEHARLSARSRRTLEVRVTEAERQIREIAGRISSR